MYSPSVLVDPNPAIPGREVVMYSSGGILIDPCTDVDFMSPARFGDKIWYHYRDKDGVWRDADGDPGTLDAPLLDRRSFSWMNDSTYLPDFVAAYVGHLSSPSVVKIGNRYFMSFVGTINDPNLCAGEHFAQANPCGTCHNRWSFFVSMWAVSDDGLNWRVYEGRTDLRYRNRAIYAATLWMGPTQKDIDLETSNFKGVSRTSMVVREEDDGTYFYLGVNFWGRQQLKAGMFRIRYDAESEWGWSKDPQIWDNATGSWEQCFDGEIPSWFNESSWRGNLFEAFFGNLSETSMVPGYRYIATLSGSWIGMSNVIAYQLSNDLVNWTPSEMVLSSIPYFADGRSYDISVSDPFYVEHRGAYHFYLASADGDAAAGIERDGVHDCDPGRYPEHPTAPFIGMGIYEGKGGRRPPRDEVRDVEPK